MKSKKKFFAVDCVKYGDVAGFALPLFAEPGAPTKRFAQQVDEVDGRIAAFVVVEGEVGEKISLDVTHEACIGDEIVLSFITEDGIAHIGRLREIEHILKAFIRRQPNLLGICLQISELVGRPIDKLNSRIRMKRFLNQEIGNKASRAFYSGSVLRSALWNNLLYLSPNEDFARKIIEARRNLYADIDEDGNLNINLSALNFEDRQLVNLDQLKANILKEFSVEEIEPTQSEMAILIDQIMPDQESVTALVMRARGAGRQEERIAILIDGLLKDRGVGNAALARYGKDRAGYANWALDLIRRELATESQPDMMQQRAAKLISDLFSAHYTLSRGELLYFLAKHLGKWPKVNEAIRIILSRTRSVMIEPFRRSIEELLDNPLQQEQERPRDDLFSMSARA